MDYVDRGRELNSSEITVNAFVPNKINFIAPSYIIVKGQLNQPEPSYLSVFPYGFRVGLNFIVIFDDF